VNINEGDYVLAVNGVPMTVDQDPWVALDGLAGKTIALTVNDRPDMQGARREIVTAMDVNQSARLRHLAWIEANRQKVARATDGQAGYIYVRSTGVDGQTELMRQFRFQHTLKALVIDERFNSGGQIPDRFVEILDRQPLAYFGVRDGQNWAWPPVANFGPKVMLINGWSGSGGDAFPDYFRRAGLGPLIGERTWGGVIGISGVPGLVDGGIVTAPTFRQYRPDGTWFAEGHGVDPDIEVVNNPADIVRGDDAQLDRAIEEIKARLKRPEFVAPKRPAREDRSRGQ
jgi:tricorn protease